MKLKPHKILPLAICGMVVAYSTAVHAQTTSIANAPEVGQGTSTSTVTNTPPPSFTPGQFTPGQQGQGHEHGKGMEKLARALDLTPQQKASLKPIIQQRRAEMMAIRKESLPREQKMAQMKAIRQSSDQQIKSILTPEQQQKLAQFLAAWKAHHHSQGQG